eukprot:144472_1
MSHQLKHRGIITMDFADKWLLWLIIMCNSRIEEGLERHDRNFKQGCEQFNNIPRYFCFYQPFIDECEPRVKDKVQALNRSKQHHRSFQTASKREGKLRREKGKLLQEQKEAIDGGGRSRS